MPGLKAVARITLAEQVALQMAEMIADKRWKPGDRLPPETELCLTLNVGRSTLREALKSLAFAGMVRMRAGDGTYVAEPSRSLLDRILARGLLKTEKDLADVCETRIVLETQLAAFAAERVTPEGLAHLDSLVKEGRRRVSNSDRSYIDADLDFHLAIADCSGNRLLPRLLADIRGLLMEWISKSQELPGLRENAQEQHERIFKSIADRDPDMARKEMQAHLETFERAYKLLGRMQAPEAIQREMLADENGATGARR